MEDGFSWLGEDAALEIKKIDQEGLFVGCLLGTKGRTFSRLGDNKVRPWGSRFHACEKSSHGCGEDSHGAAEMNNGAFSPSQPGSAPLRASPL